MPAMAHALSPSPQVMGSNSGSPQGILVGLQHGG